MPALDALRQALDVQRSTAHGVVAPVRPLPSPVSPARPVDKVTVSSQARALAAARAPGEGEPTDLEGAHGSRPTIGLTDAGRPADPGPVLVDLFA